jgi:hypothetical protein
MTMTILLACLLAQTGHRAGVDESPKNQDLRVHLLPGATVNTMSELEDSLTHSWAAAHQGTFTVRTDGKKGKWIKIRNCREMNQIDAKAADTRPADAWDALNAVSYWCRGLQAIPRAKSSKRSLLAEILAAKNPAAYIPASVVDIVNAGDLADKDPDIEASKKAHTSVSWAKFDPALKLGDVQAKDRIDFEGKDYVAAVSYYAAGDFNGDGIEDLLVEISIRSFDASQGDGAFFILTRTKPKGLLTVIETFR